MLHIVGRCRGTAPPSSLPAPPCCYKKSSHLFSEMKAPPCIFSFWRFTSIYLHSLFPEIKRKRTSLYSFLLSVSIRPYFGLLSTRHFRSIVRILGILWKFGSVDFSMGEWKGSWSRDGKYRNEGRGDQSNSWKSPHSRASNTSLDLALEKEFCQYLSSIPWGRLCYAQKYTYIYKNILQWDDSGALESFQAARSRFNAEYSGEPCDNPLPDPDMYTDLIDHNCIIDPELIADIEKDLVPPETTKARHRTSTGTNGWDSVECTDRLVPATGWESWGDSGDRDKEKDNLNDWDIYVESKPIEYTGWEDNDRFDDPWESGNKATGWGNNNISSSSAWDRKEDSNNDGWNNSWNNNSWYRRKNEANSRNGRKRDGSVGNGGFRVRKIRYTGDRCQLGNNWKGLRGRNNRNYPYNAAFS